VKCLIVDKMHNSIVSLLEAKGFLVDYLPDITREEIKEVLNHYEGLIIRSKTLVDEDLLRNSKLKFVARAGAGIDNLDQEAINNNGVRILNAPEGNRDALAEHTVGLLLALLNNIHTADRQIRGGEWIREKNRGSELRGKTVGIIGYGNMGRAFAKRLTSFECQILAFDKFKSGFSNQFVIESSLEDIFEKANILSLHLPLTRETRNMVNFDFFSKFRNSIVVINTSRGEILSLKALKYYLKKNKIIGAALDVLENEDIKNLDAKEQEMFNYLIESNKIILTPHIAGWSFESYELISQILADKIIKEFI